MFDVTVKDVCWIKGSTSVEQGYKNYYVPERAFAGSNGTFVCTTPAELRLGVVDSNGQFYSIDIIKTIRRVNGWQRLTNNRYTMLKERFLGRTLVIDSGEIIGLEDLVSF